MLAGQLAAQDMRKRLALSACVIFIALFFIASGEAQAAPNWSTKLDAKVRFYQTTELGVLVVGTEKSLYAVDGETGDVLWRRKNARLDETDVAPVPGTDLLLLSFEKDNRTRVEAADLLTGETLWLSDKVKGAVMQVALDIDSNLLAAVFVRDARGRAREGFKRRPVVHVFDLKTGDQRWEYKLESEVEMMPARWSEKEDEETEYTLDNYRAPLFLDGRLHLFYEGVTALATLRGQWMYYYTDLKDGRGLAGVNVNTGRTEREIRLSDPDDRFMTDEATGLLYDSKDDRISAYSVSGT